MLDAETRRGHRAAAPRAVVSEREAQTMLSQAGDDAAAMRDEVDAIVVRSMQTRQWRERQSVQSSQGRQELTSRNR
jgi:hypothetical protein